MQNAFHRADVPRRRPPVVKDARAAVEELVASSAFKHARHSAGITFSAINNNVALPLAHLSRMCPPREREREVAELGLSSSYGLDDRMT